jgi:hypothetical protein
METINGAPISTRWRYVTVTAGKFVRKIIWEPRNTNLIQLASVSGAVHDDIYHALGGHDSHSYQVGHE